MWYEHCPTMYRTLEEYATEVVSPLCLLDIVDPTSYLYSQVVVPRTPVWLRPGMRGPKMPTKLSNELNNGYFVQSLCVRLHKTREELFAAVRAMVPTPPPILLDGIDITRLVQYIDRYDGSPPLSHRRRS